MKNGSGASSGSLQRRILFAEIAKDALGMHISIRKKILTMKMKRKKEKLTIKKRLTGRRPQKQPIRRRLPKRRPQKQPIRKRLAKAIRKAAKGTKPKNRQKNGMTKRRHRIKSSRITERARGIRRAQQIPQAGHR